MASKIEKELTPEEVVELLETLAKTPGGHVLSVIQAEAEKRGIKVSLMGASTFRDAALQPYLEKLKFARQKSQMLAEAVAAGDEGGFLQSARTRLAEEMSDFLMEEKPEPKQFGGLAKSLNLLSTAHQGDKRLAAQLREYEAKEEARKREAEKLEARKKALVKKGGLSPEAIELMEETLKILS